MTDVSNETRALLDRLEGVRCHGKYYMARCPAHADDRPSLSVREKPGGGVYVKCFAGCHARDILSAIGLSFPYPQKQIPSSSANRSRKSQGLALPAPGQAWPEHTGDSPGIITHRYDYADEHGSPLFSVFRIRRREGGKQFRQGRINPRTGCFEKRLGNTRRALYRLPEIMRAIRMKKTIWFVEGEKDVESLHALGLVATCSPCGASAWRDYYAAPLKNARVRIIPDHDNAGRTYALEAARSMEKAGASVKILSLPGLREKEDVSDWLAADGTKRELLALRKNALSPGEWQLRPQKNPGNPTIILRGNLARTTEKAWEALCLKNAKDSQLFVRCGQIVRVGNFGSEGTTIRNLDLYGIQFHLARAASWVKINHMGATVNHYPPKNVSANILSDPTPPLPELIRLTESPVYSPEGRFLLEKGFHVTGDKEGRHSGIYVSPSPGICFLRASENPSRNELREALTFLLEDFLGDFPFEGQSERAHALGLLLLPLVREMIQGVTPLHLVEKSTPGTGATLLCDVISRVHIARGFTLLPESRDDDEWRKKITSTLMGDPTMALIDNIGWKLGSASLASALTLETWEDRLLGSSRTVRIPVRCAWMATGNNPGLSNEIARRTVRIRLDARVDRPWLRDPGEFRHGNLRGWVMNNREKIMYMLCVLVNNWMTECRPPGDKSLGMYESWANVIGGILKSAGVGGFLENLDDLYEESDEEGDVYRSFVASWYDSHGTDPVKSSELFEIAESEETPLYLGKGNEQSRKVSLGKKLSHLRDRCFDITGDNEERISLRIHRGRKSQNARLWMLEKV